MGTTINYKYVTKFQINIDDFESGWETVSLIFDETPVAFRASYIGNEPLSTLIEAVAGLDEEYISGSNESHYYIDWVSEPGCMNIALQHNLSDGRLSIEIKVSGNENIDDGSAMKWNIAMNYLLFRQAVVDLAISTLNKYGICGFNRNRDVDNDVLPVGAILKILGTQTYFDRDNGSFRSDLMKELAVLSSIASSSSNLSDI